MVILSGGVAPQQLKRWELDHVHSRRLEAPAWDDENHAGRKLTLHDLRAIRSPVYAAGLPRLNAPPVMRTARRLSITLTP